MHAAGIDGGGRVREQRPESGGQYRKGAVTFSGDSSCSRNYCLELLFFSLGYDLLNAVPNVIIIVL